MVNVRIMSNSRAENSLTYAASCTIEEAIMYLLGYSQGFVQAHWVQHSDDPADGEWVCCDGYNHLRDLLETAESEYAEAKYDKASGKIIADKLAELNRCKALNKQVHEYKSAIIDELALKDVSPKLLIDNLATTNLRYPYITLLSLKRWAHEVLQISILDELGTYKPVKRVPLLRAQENDILDAIKELGHDPKNFPKNLPGKPGAKNGVRQLVQHKPLFASSNVFDKAWERLRNDKSIIDMQ